jgi:hypothetical protein
VLQGDLPSEILDDEGWENRTAGKTRSSWYADPVPLQFQKLSQDMDQQMTASRTDRRKNDSICGILLNCNGAYEG